LQQGDWSPRYAVLSTVDQLGTVLTYKNAYPIVIKDYFEQGLDAYTEIRHYNNTTNASLYNGVIDGLDDNNIVDNDLTRVEIDYVLNSGVFPADGIYAEVNFEVFEGGGYKTMFTISTEYDPLQNNPLKGTGNNGLRLELVSVAADRIRSICLIDSSFISGSATKYKVSGRIGCSEGNILPPIPTGTPYNSKYNTKYL